MRVSEIAVASLFVVACGAPADPAPALEQEPAAADPAHAPAVAQHDLRAPVAPSTAAPADWPTGFPTIPGGRPRAAPTMGPVRVALLEYPERDVATTDRAFRDALAEAGWTVADAPAGDGLAHRFVATHDASSVSVSIYRDGSDTIVQTMQLGSPPR